MELLDTFVEKINDNDAVGLQELMKIHNTKVEAEDKQGMTMLQHASFKGKREMCQLLIDLGADPNGGHHEHKYAALHFAALSGNSDICQLLLQHGAKIDVTNSVGRTAPQMAAFVGNHHCVSVINNFIPKDDIDYYTVSKQDGAKPMLPPIVSPALHRFVMQINLHPVHLLLTIQKLPLLWENLPSVNQVLGLLCEKQMKCGKEANEILSLKYHYFDFVIIWLMAQRKQNADKSSTDLISNSIKLFLKGRTTDGYLEFMDNFIRESIRTFQFKDTTVFRQLLVNLSKTKQSPECASALSMLTSCINGQRGFAEENCCFTCGQEKVASKCSSCRAVQYCDRQCQKLHWNIHKRECDVLAKQFKALQLPAKDE